MPALIFILFLALAFAAQGANLLSSPNILFILCDDLGYGDVRALNPAGKISTPALDRLAEQGMAFTDAHSGSAVCTPSRYGILTGRYAWRTRLQHGVLWGASRPLIAPDRLTLPEMLRQNGYRTVALGKWHLGMDLPLAGTTPKNFDAEKLPVLDYSRPIQNGPTTRGFDYFYGISGSLDMPPFVYIENDHFTAPAPVEKKFMRTGPAAADFEAENVLPELTVRAVKEIAADAKSGKPFFIYLALTSPHTPILPTAQWRGKSGLNAYGDFVMETDDCIGKVLDALDRAGLASNTLVILTSDNGCSPAAGVKELEAKGHFPSAQFRGYKADIWDGGHRIPFIARWPGQVSAGSTNNQLICLNDFMATCGEFLGAKIPANAAEDSVSFWPALRGEKSPAARTTLVHHSIDGSFAIRDGRWKLEFCAGSGGWSEPTPGSAVEKKLPPVQLYDVQAEAGERANLQAAHPEIVARLKSELEKIIADGRSTPGPVQTNDALVRLIKARSPAGLSGLPD